MRNDLTMRNTVERHVQTFIQFILLAVLAWVGATVVDLRDSSNVLTTQVSELKNQVNAMNGRFDAYMPRNETEAKLELESSRHVEISRRLDALEREVGTR